MADKDTHILIRIQKEEKLRLVQAAKADGVPLSTWMRDTLKNACTEVVSTIGIITQAIDLGEPKLERGKIVSPFASSNIPAKLPTRSTT